MKPAPKSKNLARLEARLSPEVKALMQKAADLEGRSLTDFVVTSAQAAAYAVIERHHTLKLTLEDSEAFVETLLQPPEPNTALQQAVIRYQEKIAAHGA